ncbi:MAG: type IV pilus assembly protein PilM [Candidatus Omnitrophica bacterium]|nr:type IV pilus assembly protein PilM [Candidatus Omnitrophota bacterium]
MSIDKNIFLGIDIGSSSLKIALLSKEKGGRIKLLKAVCDEYTSYPITADNQNQTELLSYFLKKFLIKENISRDTRIGISIAGQSAFVRLVKVPITAPEKLRQIVLYETQQQVPFPIKEVVWDFQIYGRDKKQLSVLLAAVKKELTGSILSVISDFSLNVEFIDVSNLALYNCLHYFYRDLKETLVLDIGAKTTNIIIINEGKIWTRSLPIGGQDITDSIAATLKIDIALAEKVKREQGKVLMLYYGQKLSQDTEEQKIAESITEILTDMTNEIVKTLNFYKSQHKSDMNFKKVLLTGGVSKIDNIDKFFENSLSLSVEKLDYLNFLGFSSNIDVSINEFLGPAIGLALRGHGRSMLNINLLSQEHLQKKNFRKKVPFILSACVFLGLILLGFFMLLLSQNRQLLDYSNEINNQVDKYEQASKQLDALQKEINAVKNNQKALNVIIDARYLVIEILSEITKSMPGAVWIKNFDLNLELNTLVLEGNCGHDLNAVDYFQNQIKSQEIFKDVKVSTVDKKADGSIDFSLTIFINK